MVIKRFLKKLLSRIYLHLQSIAYNEELNNLKSLPNVKIGSRFLMEENSNFYLQGLCKELTIKNGFHARRFCSFLLHEKARLVIADNVFFNNSCSVNCLGDIEIGENTLFGENVKMYDHNHNYKINDDKKLMVERHGFNIGRIKIGSNCWIGSNVTILKNVEIGNNVIVGANCLIHKSVPSNSIVKSNSSIDVIGIDG